jgi:toxin ParE1/3/4
MATRRRRVVWTEQAGRMLDDAVSYVAQDSPDAAGSLLIQALEAASALEIHSERGRVIPELNQTHIRQLLVQRYRLVYAVTPAEVQVLAFVHGARDLTDSESRG